MKGKKRGHLNGLFLLLALPMSVWADLTVIYDSGQTRPIAPYLKSIQQIESRSAKVSASNPDQRAWTVGGCADNQFVTHSLTGDDPRYNHHERRFTARA